MPLPGVGVRLVGFAFISYSSKMEYLAAPEQFEENGFRLRSYRLGDGPLLADAVNSSYEHLKPWMPWVKPEQTVAESEGRARQNRGHYLLADDFTIGIFSRDENQLLGGSGFHLREGGLSSKAAEIGMFVRESAAGQGLGTKVLVAMLRWGFDEWPWERLAWCCDSKNSASIRIAEKAGMEREGVFRRQPAHVGAGWRDTVCFAALRGEWQP